MKLLTPCSLELLNLLYMKIESWCLVPSFILSNLMEAYYHRPGRPWPRNQSRLKEPEHRFELFSIRRCFRCVYVCRLVILLGTARGSLTISYHCKWVLYIRPALGAQLKSVQRGTSINSCLSQKLYEDRNIRTTWLHLTACCGISADPVFSLERRYLVCHGLEPSLWDHLLPFSGSD